MTQPNRRLVLLRMSLSVTILLLVGGTTALAAPLAGHNSHGSAASVPNPDCTLTVPADPLSAQGLATPYLLSATNPANGPCHEANAAQSAFVEAAILGPNGQLTLYDPLVIDRGTKPAAAPVPARVPAGATVGIWFGYNGANLTLRSTRGGKTLTEANCVNGLDGSLFGQFAYCDAVAFFQAANAQIAASTLRVPPLGTASDGLTCPSTRSFAVVDQDQSDNVVTAYLATADGRIAQNNAANRAALGNNTVNLANGSDNLLLTHFMDPALGCVPWTVPNQSSDGQPGDALPLDELQAAAFQPPPVALVPLNDPMTLVTGVPSVAKTNLYRVGVDQLPIGGGGDNGSGATYCRNLFGDEGIVRVFNDKAIFSAAPSVDPAAATNLFTFLAMRGNQSFTNLGCGDLLGVANPITLTVQDNVVTDASFTPLGQHG